MTHLKGAQQHAGSDMLNHLHGPQVLTSRCCGQRPEARNLELKCLLLHTIAMKRGQGKEGLEDGACRGGVANYGDSDENFPKLLGILTEGR